MKVKQLFDDGNLTAAIAEATQQVKARPADAAARTFLFELLCFAGELDRAEKQLEVIGHQDAQSEWAVTVYRNLLKAERARRRLFADGLAPQFLLDPPDYVRLHLDAVNRLREDQPGEALSLLEHAEEARPAVAARVNGGSLGELRDCDDLFAPILEMMLLEDYIWLPYEQIRELEVSRPERPRDLVWAPARVVLVDGTQRSGYLPALYHDSHQHADDQVRLGRKTDWLELPGGPTLGQGLRTLLWGEEALSLLDCRQIQVGAGEAISG
ncbi:MAG TPA: type VI secretion system accessory protein TagJ [Pirellulales bacterium]